MRLLILGLIGLLLLSACATPGFDCPSIKNYSAEEQDEVADALAAEPAGSVLARWIADYGVMRNETRACKGEPIEGN